MSNHISPEDQYQVALNPGTTRYFDTKAEALAEAEGWAKHYHVEAEVMSPLHKLVDEEGWDRTIIATFDGRTA